jgi:hypothetical protein
MLLEQLKNRVQTVLDGLLEKWKTRLPFNGYYLRAFRDALIARIEATKAQWEQFFAKEGEFSNADKLVDFLIDLIRGNLKLPPLIALFAIPFEGLILESLRAYLKANLPKVRDQFGTVQP